MLNEIIRSAQKRLESAGIENPKSDVLFLLAHALGVKRSRLINVKNITCAQKSKFNAYISKRAKRAPVAHIIGEWDFMGFTFKINKNVLIPRPETELITEAAVAAIKINNHNEVLDLCAGSGCIGISIAKLTSAGSTLLDISPSALSIAKKNAAVLNAKCKFILSDGFSKIKSGAKYNLIISNPPYIIESDFAKLEPEVKKEPKIALTAPDGGLHFYKIIADNARNFLYNNGCVIVELNSKLDIKIFNIFKKAKFKNIEFIKNYDGANIGLKTFV